MFSNALATGIVSSLPPLLVALAVFLWRVDRRVYRIERALGLKNGHPRAGGGE